MSRGVGGQAVCVECGGAMRRSKQTACLSCRRKPRVCPWCGETFTPSFASSAAGFQRFCSSACALRPYNSNPEHQSGAGKLGGDIRGEQRKRDRTSGWYLKESGQHVHR